MTRIMRAVLDSIGRCWFALILVGSLLPGVAQAERPTEPDIPALIEQLGDPDYLVRQRAQKRLEELGPKAYDALTIAVNDSDLEVAARARYLLRTIELPVIRDEDSELVRTMLENYGDLSTSDQLDKIRSLMGLPEGQGFRAACRLAHLEDSVVMSKYIAATILIRWPVHTVGRTAIREAIDAELVHSGRKVARWLKARAAVDADSKPNLEPWREIVEEEAGLLEQRSPKTSERVVASLLYDLAYWESESGAAEAARNHFRQAQEVDLVPSGATISFYLDTAYFFRNRGQIDRAAQVYGRVSKMGYADAVPLAQVSLAEMYHDMGRNQEAAAASDVILKMVDSGQLSGLKYLDQGPGQVRGRRHFFLACHERDRGNDEQYRRHLLEAIRHDPNEIDALIALYRIPDLEESERQRTVALIDAAGQVLRQESEAAPEDASAHNQFAWLVGNTKGDMQEALRHAQRAVELRPESGAYLDTLAHVYFFGLADYEKAVETQAKAVEFMPHSGLIRKKYEMFRKAAAEAESEQ